MYFTEKTLHFNLEELLCCGYLVDIFDKDVSKRILNIYHYHKDCLGENNRQPLQLTSIEVERFRLRKKINIISKNIQPEFVFSDDEDIF